MADLSGHPPSPEHRQACLDCSIEEGKRLAIAAYIPTAGDVEPFIPEPLKRAFWERYTGKYFEGALKVKP